MKKNFRNQKVWGLRSKTYLTVLLTLIVVLPVIIFGKYYKNQENITAKYYNIAQAHAQTIKKLTVKPEQLSEHEQIVLEIKKVFGKDSNKAFQLLDCENKSLNPKARNINKDGSIDHSVFQINSYWQKTQGKFLDNWKVNILIAKQLFDESNSFKMWTCGKRLGI